VAEKQRDGQGAERTEDSLCLQQTIGTCRYFVHVKFSRGLISQHRDYVITISNYHYFIQAHNEDARMKYSS